MDEHETVTHPLDDPVRSALSGPHAHLAQRRGRILRYPPDVLRFIAIPDPPGPADWADVAALTGGDAGPGAGVVVAPPEGWVLTNIGAGLQLVDSGEAPVCPDSEAVRLGLDASLSHSCYDPGSDGAACGACDACRLRAKGFEEAGLPDPTRYAERPTS